MLNRRTACSGFSLIEVLVSILIIAIGLLSLAGFQLKSQSAELESYQRAQALALLNDMAERLAANGANAPTYVSTTIWGTGETTYTAPADCAALAVGSAARDQCEWSVTLQGAAEMAGATARTGAMVGARGCLSQIQAPVTGTCTPGVYEVAVAWQGFTPTRSPPNTCAQGLYGTNDALRRVISMRITVGMPAC